MLKVGTKVKIIDNRLKGFITNFHNFPIGTTGEIIRINENNESYVVKGIDFNLVQNVKRHHIIEVKEQQREQQKVKISNDDIATYINVGGVVIAIPRECPMGISKTHPDDTFDIEIGKSIAFKRLFIDGMGKGLI